MARELFHSSGDGGVTDPQVRLDVGGHEFVTRASTLLQRARGYREALARETTAELAERSPLAVVARGKEEAPEKREKHEEEVEDDETLAGAEYDSVGRLATMVLGRLPHVRAVCLEELRAPVLSDDEGSRQRMLEEEEAVTSSRTTAAFMEVPGQDLLEVPSRSGSASSASAEEEDAASATSEEALSLFIDRDWRTFRHVLNYLRSGAVVIPPDVTLLCELMVEARFYRLDRLLRILARMARLIPSELMLVPPATITAPGAEVATHVYEHVPSPACQHTLCRAALIALESQRQRPVAGTVDIEDVYGERDEAPTDELVLNKKRTSVEDTSSIEKPTLKRSMSSTSVEEDFPQAAPVATVSEAKEITLHFKRPVKMGEYTWEEVSKHCTEDDCWLVVGKVVYDVTPVLAHHPGGASCILRRAAAGSDASIDFGFHSTNAQKLWKKFKIGVVKDSRAKSTRRRRRGRRNNRCADAPVGDDNHCRCILM